MLSLTDDQIEQYRRDGFLIVDDIIGEQAAADVLSRYEPLFEKGEFETGVRPDEVNLPEGGKPYTKQICNGWRADLTVARNVMDAGIGEACARLGGWDGARLMVDNLLWKPPEGRPIGFHQDSMYATWFDKPGMASCWIALDKTTAEGGTLMYIRGSHKWGEAQPILKFHGPEDDLKEAREWAESQGYEMELVPIEVPPGGGAFHDGWLWHGSRINAMDVPRRSIAIHMVSSDVKFAPENFGVGNGPMYGRYMRFGSNEVEESHFPITWHRSGYRTPGLDEYVARGPFVREAAASAA
ncbi:phytanoyl-CoA dioxygenase family protein [Methyloligella sp. 2.7D]|uniref:phytanoyl-CoA dioxygenase family protein n=1 Tax=unclassified Methyloligella TaxID=2625955 RepID=UPI00157BCDB8|nr:phytanoyl-CoA dioxygenase family protein [Methyloligella sp. GL2]QKP76220.1 phytanoyl-CoA dioxygenase family protein [Methyloligella sp. GL2]